MHKTNLLPLFNRVTNNIDRLMNTKELVIVAIDGMAASGKSTLTNHISDLYDCNVFHMDDFFLGPDLRTEQRLEEAATNVDYLRFTNEVMDGIKSRNEFSYSGYNRKTDTMMNKTNVLPKKLNIIEGAYSMHPVLIDNYDLKVFLMIDPKEQSARIFDRDGEFIHRKFISQWIPLENEYFSKLNIREKSDFLIDSSTNL